jgi:epoxyqueuosine reductase
VKAETQKFIQSLFSDSSLNRLPEAYGGGRIFDAPVIGVARGDDPIFEKFKQVVGPEHMTPLEMWLAAGPADDDNRADRLRLVSIIFPYVHRIRRASQTAREFPAEIYCIGRNFANAFMIAVLQQTVAYFQQKGFGALAAMLSPAFEIIVKQDPIRIYSKWSERHIAFAAGLGTFSLHEGLITDVGCNIRVASVITDAPLEATTRRSDAPYANCLFYAGKKCKKCAERCPADAITEKGHDKLKCYLYGRRIETEMNDRLGPILKPHRRVIDGREQTSYPVGCAFCQFDVPCMDRNPVSST